MPRSIVLAFVCLAMLTSKNARANSFSGTIIQVDGNVASILDAKGRTHHVRLHAIYTPVDDQPYHDASQKAFEALALKKHAWVDWFEQKGPNVVGKVFLNGEDLAIKLLQKGAAWYDHRQASDQSVSDRGLYQEAQDEAKRKKLGLWRDLHAVEPWAWKRAADRAEKALAVKPKAGKQK